MNATRMQELRKFVRWTTTSQANCKIGVEDARKSEIRLCYRIPGELSALGLASWFAARGHISQGGNYIYDATVDWARRRDG